MEYNDKYNKDLLKYIIKNKSKFNFSILDVITFNDNDYTTSILKSSNKHYAIYIRYKGDKVHNFKISSTDEYYTDIKNIIEPLLQKQNDDLSNEKKLIKLLGKDNRYNKLQKIIKELDDE